MKVNKLLGAVILIALVGGLIAGYGIWGKKGEEKLDVKQLLSKTIQEVEIIEKENKDLKSRLQHMIDSSKEVDRLSQEAKKLSRENETLQAQLQKSQEDNVQLENLLAQVNDELSVVKEKIQTQAALLSLSDNLKIRVSELEKENEDLRNVLEGIRSLTQEKKMNVPEGVEQENTVIPENTVP